MKFKTVNQISGALAIGLVFGCSKHDIQTQIAPHGDAAPDQTSITLNTLYQYGQNGIVSEYINTGKVGISAFKGTLTVVDDVGDAQGQQEDKYTSETPFVVGTNQSYSHVIAPGETIELMSYVNGDDREVCAMTKENFSAIIAGIADKEGGPTNIDDLRTTRKFTFTVEKIVAQR